MGDISPHFNRKEFACKCGCGIDNIDPKLPELAEFIRAQFIGRAMIINCGCRCVKHNADVGGAPKSYHITTDERPCKAIDFVIAGITPDKVQKKLDPMIKGGMEYAPTWTHCDLGPHRRFKP